ncbi:helix-turn-helix domain-containing protein [Actinomadura sp. 1N219]|uniref:helix-turn-helix domain-containing protein n=1 Tax=Actinomadura sp. 1N219 TaxID=3375152 RepID=UPI0037A86544
MASPRRRAVTSPALAAFGRQFRRYRERAGLSQARVGQRTGKTASFVSQVESGKKRCKRQFVEIMDPELKAGGVLLNLYDDLARDDGRLGVPTWFDWPEVEAEANVLTWWEHTIIPGLLQKERYARAFLGTDEKVAARMARQEILTRDVPAPTTLLAFVSENALSTLTGSPEIMREQLEHLIVMSELPNVTIQVVMHDDGVPAATGGAFILATMNDRSEVAYLETTVRGITTEDENDLTGLAQALRTLGSKALPANMTREMIRKVIETKWT